MSDPQENRFASFQPRSPDDPRPPLPPGLIVRPGRSEDIGALTDLHLEREGGRSELIASRFRRETSAGLDPEPGLILVARLARRLVGFGRVLRFDPPPTGPPDVAPAGWYLAGLIVAPGCRRMGIGAELTRRRLEWIAERSTEAFYFANSSNAASIALHARFAFAEVTRKFVFPGVVFRGGEGILFRSTKLR